MSEAAKPALHHSVLAGLSRCPKQVEHFYVFGRKNPPGVAAVIGTAVHKTADRNLVAKMITGELLSEKEVLQIAGESLDATWVGEDPLLDAEQKARGVAVVRGKAKDDTIALARLHHRELAPDLNPLAVERKMRLVLEGFPFDVEGTIDVEEEDSDHDLKTAAKTPKEDAAEGHPQLSMYSMVRSIIDKKQKRWIKLDTLVKTKRPKLVVVKARAPSPEHFSPILRRLEIAAKIFDAGLFYPVDPSGPSGWVCTPKFCGYYDVCEFGARARVQV